MRIQAPVVFQNLTIYPSYRIKYSSYPNLSFPLPVEPKLWAACLERSSGDFHMGNFSLGVVFQTAPSVVRHNLRLAGAGDSWKLFYKCDLHVKIYLISEFQLPT